MNETLYIIDVFSVVFQVFHAVPARSNAAGLPTNAAFGVTRDLLNILKQKKPTYLVAAIDSSSEESVRNELYTEYKANRSAMPEDLSLQIPMIVQLFEAFGIPLLDCPGWEADDVIATLVEQSKDLDLDVQVITSDKDIRQLLGPRVKLYNLRKRQSFGVEQLQEDWGVTPEQVIDFQALVGDAVDNVPGVPQIGPKTATALIQQFGTLDELLERVEEVKQNKVRENLKTYREQALLSRQLVTLSRSLPIELDLTLAKSGQIQFDRLLDLMNELDFPALRQEISDMLPADRVPARLSRTTVVVDTWDAFDRLVEELSQRKRFCLDLETTGLNSAAVDIVGWAISWEDARGYYIPIRAPAGVYTLDDAKVIEKLKPILESPDLELCNQNIKYDLTVLRTHGIHVRGIHLDPLVASYLIDAGARMHGLDTLSRRYLNHRMIPIQKLIGKGNAQKSMFEVSIEEIAEYAVEDAEIAWRLSRIMENELQKNELWQLYDQLERPLILVLTDMEASGIKVNAEILREESRSTAVRLAEIQKEIHGLARREFNIDSPIQLREILFQELKLPIIKRTKTGPSTDQDVLEELSGLHPLPKLLSHHRHLSKLKSTYLDALPEMINPRTGRIHASFNQGVAATGRLSSSDPNLQNIPIRTEEGRRIREAFIPGEPGWKLLSADYSQIELRMLAHFCQDRALLEAFEAGADIHSSVASELFNVPQDSVSSEQRRMAKAVNFGVIYGQTPFGLAVNLGITKEEAAQFIEGYFERFAGVARFIEETLDTCRATGVAKTILGRRRAISGIRSAHRRSTLSFPERTAINTVIQGSAADLIKQAMVNLHDRLQKSGSPARILLQIHDELVLEAPQETIPELAEIVRHEMSNALDLSVPIEVDVGIGDNWLNLQEV